MKRPRTAAEFNRPFSTEEACWDNSVKLRWPEGFRCSDCGSPTAWPRRARSLGVAQVNPPCPLPAAPSLRTLDRCVGAGSMRCGGVSDKRPRRVRRPEPHPENRQRQDGMDLVAHTVRAMVRATRRLSAVSKRAEGAGHRAHGVGGHCLPPRVAAKGRDAFACSGSPRGRATTCCPSFGRWERWAAGE